MIRVMLPFHLRTLARVDEDVIVEVSGPATIRSVLDALDLGFSVTVVRDACRGIDLQPGDSDRALAKAAAAGARLVTSAELGRAA